MNDSKPITLRDVLDFVRSASKDDRAFIAAALVEARDREIWSARAEHRVGDKVEFTVTKRGFGPRTVVGTITRKNVKTFHVKPADGGREWRVTPTMVRKHTPKAN